jgi:hypothetical protein
MIILEEMSVKFQSAVNLNAILAIGTEGSGDETQMIVTRCHSSKKK